jgi:hypothetical protein
MPHSVALIASPPGAAATTWKTHFGNGHRWPLVIGKAPITDQLLQMSQKGDGQMPVTDNTYS